MKLNNNSKNKNKKIVMTTIKTIIVSMIIMITKITRNNKKNKNINNIFKNTKIQLISNIYIPKFLCLKRTSPINIQILKILVLKPLDNSSMGTWEDQAKTIK